MKYRVIGLVLVGVLAVFGFGGACDELKEACGPCGSVEAADGAISGDASLDAFFKAVGDLNKSVGKINAGFEGNVKALAEAFGVATVDADGNAIALDVLVDDVVLAIEGEFEANVQGSIKIDYAPPKCAVDVNASFSASAQCEAKAGCDVDVECSGGEISFECSGTCEGKCEGECSVPVCTVAMDASLACSGECSGKCTAPSASVECSGECRGTCEGECSAYDGAGNCQGACDGQCDGECAVETTGGSCEAKCEGECKAQVAAEAECQGELGCKGECSGSCSGGCKGEVSAPKCSANAECEASAKCEAQANASASANVSCTPPSLKLSYVLNASLDANGKAEFEGKIKAFKDNMIGMLQGMANLKILVDADAAAEIGLEATPVETLGASVSGLIDAATNGDFEIKPALLGCTLDALDETGQIFADLPSKLTASVEGQAKFYGILFGG